MDDGNEEQLKPLHWPGKWSRSEGFWRGVVSQALSGIIVVFVSYMGALWLGHIKSPNGLKSAFEATFLVALLISTVLFVDRYSDAKVSKRLAKRMNKWLARLLSFAIMTVLNLMIVFALYLILWSVFKALNALLGLNQEM